MSGTALIVATVIVTNVLATVTLARLTRGTLGHLDQLKASMDAGFDRTAQDAHRWLRSDRGVLRPARPGARRS